MRVAITTLGCKINQYDSAVIQGRLEEESHTLVSFQDKADCYIINACTVTDRADWEARQLIRRAKRQSPSARILVTGCYAQVSPQEVAQVPDVDFVIGLNRLDDLVRFLQSPSGNRERKIAVGDPREERGIRTFGAKRFPDHTRAFLKIEEGFNYSCTYCIIPIARGRSRSLSEREVMQQVSVLARAGFRELVLTGIHLGAYGQDLKPKTDLVHLLARIVESGLMPRVRLSSLDPREVTDSLLELMASSDVVCPHLHICIQAGDDGILKRMRRNYNTIYFQGLIQRTREILPTASLGTDLIVGFPGETEEDFDRSVAFLDSLPLTYFHVFPYSVRSGTVAANLPNPVSFQVKKERARIVRELSNRKKRAFYHDFIGTEVPVLVEREVKGVEGFYKGYSRNYLPVAFPGHAGQVNHEVRVAVERLEGNQLFGEVVGPC